MGLVMALLDEPLLGSVVGLFMELGAHLGAGVLPGVGAGILIGQATGAGGPVGDQAGALDGITAGHGDPAGVRRGVADGIVRVLHLPDRWLCMDQAAGVTVTPGTQVRAAGSEPVLTTALRQAAILTDKV